MHSVSGAAGGAQHHENVARSRERKKKRRAAEPAHCVCSRHSELSGEAQKKEGREGGRATPFSLVTI